MFYRKKPVKIQAKQFLGEANLPAINDFVEGNLEYDLAEGKYYIETLEGNMYFNVGDYIVKGVEGEYYPVKEGIFETTYEKADIPVNADAYFPEEERRRRLNEQVAEIIGKATGENLLSLKACSAIIDVCKLDCEKELNWLKELAEKKKLST